MALSAGEKIAIVGGVAGAAIVVGAAAVMAKKSKVTITATTIVITVTPTGLPSSGGKITINGTTTNIPAGTSISILVNGKTIDTFALSGSSFSVTYDVSPNTSTTLQTLTIVATGAGVKSNPVTIDVAPSVTTETVDVTVKTDAGATVTISGHSEIANSSGEAFFRLNENTTYTASGKLTVTTKSLDEICEELYEGSVSFTTGKSAQTVSLPLTLIARKCYPTSTTSPSISLSAIA